MTTDEELMALVKKVDERIAYYEAQCHRNEDCSVVPLEDELNRVKWLVSAEEREKINAVLDRANPLMLK